MTSFQLLLERYQPVSPFSAFAASDQKCYHRSSALFRMHGSESQQQVVPNSYVEGGFRQQLAGSPAASAYQGFLPAEMESSRSVDNLHSPPEPAGSSYSSPVFLSVSKPALLTCLLHLYSVSPSASTPLVPCCCSIWWLVLLRASQSIRPCTLSIPSRPGCRRSATQGSG